MTCEETQNLLDAYVDGELDWSSKLAIESHLQGCPPAPVFLRASSYWCLRCSENRSGLSAPEHVKSVVLSGIERANPAVLHSFADWRWVAVCASFVVIVALSWMVATWTGEAFSRGRD
jgi:predicted anti-sigma-YlaC factor YlaD